VKLRIACLFGALGGGNQRRRARDIARARGDHLLDPNRPRAIERPGLELLDLAQERKHCLGLSELVGKLRSRQQAPPALRRVAELRRASHRRECLACRASPASPAAGLLELHRDILVRSADQRRAMPRPTIGLTLEHLRERLVNTPTLRHAGALANRRAHQRVAEAHRLCIELDNRGVDGWLERGDIDLLARDRAACPEHLVDVLAVDQGRNENEQARLLGEL
jgi:hypothetical protein